MKKDAVLSEDRKYRYLLSRNWDDTKPTVLFIGLNPSTADEKEDDPTINKCISYAKSWGNPGRLLNRDKEVISLISDLYCLKQKWYTPSPTLFIQGNKTISLYTINSYSIKSYWG